MSEPILSVQGLQKRFGGLTAVAGVSLSVPCGSVAGLIGPNGSGKTTTFNLISGITMPDAGSVRLFGGDVTGRQAHEIVERGLARTFQHIRLFPQMTAVENVMAARFVRSRGSFFGELFCLPRARRARRADEEMARRLLERVGIVARQDTLARRLGFLDQHLVEIARALATEPQILLLDEPTTGMIASEADTLAALIRDLTAHGMTIVVVEHNMNFVMRLCDPIIVMELGRVIAEGPPPEVSTDPRVVAAYLGESSDGAA